MVTNQPTQGNENAAVQAGVELEPPKAERERMLDAHKLLIAGKEKKISKLKLEQEEKDRLMRRFLEAKTLLAGISAEADNDDFQKKIEIFEEWSDRLQQEIKDVGEKLKKGNPNQAAAEPAQPPAPENAPPVPENGPDETEKTEVSDLYVRWGELQKKLGKDDAQVKSALGSYSHLKKMIDNNTKSYTDPKGNVLSWDNALLSFRNKMTALEARMVPAPTAPENKPNEAEKTEVAALYKKLSEIKDKVGEKEFKSTEKWYKYLNEMIRKAVLTLTTSKGTVISWIDALSTFKNKMAELEKKLAPAEAKPAAPAKTEAELKAEKARAEAQLAAEKALAEEKERKKGKKIIDLSERELFELLGKDHLREVINLMIVAKIEKNEKIKQQAGEQLKNTFSRAGIDPEKMKGMLEKFGYTPKDFMDLWSEKLYVHLQVSLNAWLEREVNKWVSESMTTWDKIKLSAYDRAKVMALNILPVLGVAGGVAVALSSLGVGAMVIAGATGGAATAMTSLKKNWDKLKGWFSRKGREAQESIENKTEKLAIERRGSQECSAAIKNDFNKDDGKIVEILAMMSQSLRDSSAHWLDKKGPETSANIELAVEQVMARVEVEKNKNIDVRGREEAEAIAVGQEQRARALLKGLYDAEDFARYLKGEMQRNPKIVEAFSKLNALRSLDLNELFKNQGAYEEPRSDAKKVAYVLVSAAAGSSVALLFASRPELRAIVGALVGGYLGAKAGSHFDQKKQEENLLKEFDSQLHGAEEMVRAYEEGTMEGKKLPEDLSVLKEYAEKIRVPLNLGLLDSQGNLSIRAKNVLRRIEEISIETTFKQIDEEQASLPENQRNSAVERLLSGLNEDLLGLQQAKKNTKEILTKKRTSWRTILGATLGMVAGAVGTYFVTEKIQEHRAEAAAEAKRAAATELAAHKKGAAEAAVALAETKQPAMEIIPGLKTKDLGDIDHDGVIVTAKGPSSAAHHLDEYFKKQGVKWGSRDIVAEMKRHGYVFHKDGTVDHPVMFHKDGGKLVPWVDENGKPHFEIVGVKKGGVDQLKTYWQEGKGAHAGTKAIPGEDIYHKMPRYTNTLEETQAELKGEVFDTGTGYTPKLSPEDMKAGDAIYSRLEEMPPLTKEQMAEQAAVKAKGAVEVVQEVKVKKSGKIWDLQDWNGKTKGASVENVKVAEVVPTAKFDADLKMFQNNWDDLFNDHLPHDTGKIVNGLEDKISRSLFDRPDLQSKFDKIMNNTRLSQDQKLEKVVDLLPPESLTVEERLMLGGKYIEDPKVFASISEDGYVYTIARKGSHALRILNAGTGKLDFSSSSLQGDLYLLGSDGRIGRMKP